MRQPEFRNPFLKQCEVFDHLSIALSLGGGYCDQRNIRPSVAVRVAERANRLSLRPAFVDSDETICVESEALHPCGQTPALSGNRRAMQCANVAEITTSIINEIDLHQARCFVIFWRN